MALETRSTERRDGAVVHDVTFDGRDGSPVEAYLVAPADPPPGRRGAGVVFWHWFDPKAPDGDRRQFVDEAAGLARLGVVSLLPQGRFPWAHDPSGAQTDVAAIEAEVARLQTGIDLLAAHPAVDTERLAIVGHDFGGMLAVLGAASDARVHALVVIAATPRWADWFLPFWDIPDDRIDYLRALRPLDPIERLVAVTAPTLFQFAANDFFIAPMTALEFRSSAREGTAARTYPGVDHAMRSADARRDRDAFLAEQLGFDVPPSGG